jgi:hypothetical protein
MISNTVIRLGTIFFDISKAHCATAQNSPRKLSGRLWSLHFAEKMLPKNIESRS